MTLAFGAKSKGSEQTFENKGRWTPFLAGRILKSCFSGSMIKEQGKTQRD